MSSNIVPPPQHQKKKTFPTSTEQTHTNKLSLSYEWTNNFYSPLTNAQMSRTLLHIPLHCFGRSGMESSYSISIKTNSHFQAFDGYITHIYYGFIYLQQEEEISESSESPFTKWQNSWGQFQAEGAIRAQYVSNGEFYGGVFQVLTQPLVSVPKDALLVFNFRYSLCGPSAPADSSLLSPSMILEPNYDVRFV